LVNGAIFAANNVEKALGKGYESLCSKVTEIFDVMKKMWGPEYIEAVIEKEKLKDMVSSNALENRIYALQRIVLKEDTYVDDPIYVLDKIEKKLASIIAKKQVESKIQKEVEKILDEKQDKLLDELRLSILKKQRGPENSKTFKKLVNLQKMDTIKLSRSIMEHLRPSCIEEIIGQKNAVAAILSKLASPYPQHIILYGPPGVGKTTTARLALSLAKRLKTSPFTDYAAFI
jgi:ATP-dependent Lon protease